MSSLVKVPTGKTRGNSFFEPYVPTNRRYGDVKGKLEYSNQIGLQSRLTAPPNLFILPRLHPKMPLGGRGQSNAVQRVVYH